MYTSDLMERGKRYEKEKIWHRQRRLQNVYSK
jgi:hypothetical protein